MPMLRVPEPLGWLALRPVERWQFAGFLAVATLRGAGHKVGDVRTMKPERLTDGPETGPVTRVLRDEASLYAQWFGKLVADRTDWQLVAESHRSRDALGRRGRRVGRRGVGGRVQRHRRSRRSRSRTTSRTS